MNNSEQIAQIVADFFNTTNPIPLFKQLIKEQSEQLRQLYNPSKTVHVLLAQKSDIIDAILQCSWQHYLGAAANQLSLLAVGGYGRRELFPYSDIDILLLLNNDHDRQQHQDALTNFSTFLWDIGLKPGQSARSLDECIKAATEDQTILTSLLEMRLITGNSQLYNAIRLATHSDKLWPPKKFFSAKMEEQRQRY